MRKPLLACLFVGLLAACKGPGVKHQPPPNSLPHCGDGTVNPGEDCDGSDLAGATCQSQGFDTGQLTCDDACRFVKTACVKRCGNGTLELGEACDGTLGLQACATFGYQACDDACQVDTRHCTSPALELGPALELVRGGPAVIGDLPPRGPGDLLVAVPSFSRVELYPWVVPQGFDAPTSRKLAVDVPPVSAALCDADGDGASDVVTLSTDGSVRQALFNGTGFSPQAVDAGLSCGRGRFAGAGDFGRGGKFVDVALAGCGEVLVVGNGSARRLRAPGAGTVAAGDLSGDGKLDLGVLSSDGAELSIWVAPSFDAGVPLAFPAPATELALGDLDGDGDLDAVAIIGGAVTVLENLGASYAVKTSWADPSPGFVAVLDVDLDGLADVAFAAGDDVVVRRNRGSWLFSEHRLSAGAGPRLSVAFGDADGDGDPDVAVTVSTGTDSTRTTVLRNRVR